ncbi:hypothetical protein PTRG_04934 [Pyrenophora tritici-repentis Pt-1C-BFP]|uniref:Uncharacterized protein n=1 Tax=Pyrenophora tritici-repentis (strain Pt-1C-BFP) TaxID=426418 RepID=B2W5N4_PYRTR|nr:uncharacterized protein PTRG_04934 [Pyrenophora tritici-repentis Pt-1C-BFP]EDU47841.1 hypothetical protein PTRG_04934 [Pyrenophora tritici-repentis Pt-1C-BFP]
MKFNIASTLKTVAQRLNPDLEIPNSPPPAGISTTTTTTTTTSGRKTSSPPLPQSSFSASSSPSPKKPRKSRSTSWTKTRNRASSNVSSVFRRSSASIALPVFMSKIPVPPVKVEEEKKTETVGKNETPVSLCRDFAVESKGKEREVSMEMPMDTPQRPSTPMESAMQIADTALMSSHAYTPVFISSSPPRAVDTLAGVPEPDMVKMALVSHSASSSVYSLVPSVIEETPETDVDIYIASAPAATRREDSMQETALELAEETQQPPLETETPNLEKATLEASTLPPPPPTSAPPPPPATATSTCLCTAIHLSFPLSSPTPRPTSTSPLLLCTCLACSKTCASVYAAGYSVDKILQCYNDDVDDEAFLQDVWYAHVQRRQPFTGPLHFVPEHSGRCVASG